MKRTTKTKLKAWIFILGSMFLTLMIAEIIFLLRKTVVD